MKKYISLLLATLSYIFPIYSQNSFVTEIGKPGQNTVAYNTIELDDGSFIAVGCNGDRDFSNMLSYIAKVSPNGDILAVIKEEKEDTFFIAKDIQILSNGNFTVLYRTEVSLDDDEEGNNTIVITEYTPSLEAVNTATLAVPGNADLREIQMKVKNDTLYCLGKKAPAETEYHSYFIYKITKQGDSIMFKDFIRAYDDVLLANDDKIYVTGPGYFDGQFYTVGKLDAISLELENNFDLYQYPYFYADPSFHEVEIESKSDTTLIFLAQYHEKSVVGIIDTSLTIKNYEIYLNDPIEELSYHHSLSAGPSAYYIGTGYILGQYFHVRKLDADLSILWDKYLYYDDSWVFSSTNATKDGGCIVTATYIRQNEMGIRLIKFDAEGNLPTSVTENLNIKATEQILYPNPGNSELHIKTAIQKLGGEFILYDIAGKVVLQTTIKELETNINTQNLPPGVYFHAYFYENNKIESGKWVKE